jgi:hypothetical protein
LGREVDHASEFIRRQKLGAEAPSAPGEQFGTKLGNVFAQLGIELPQTPFGEKREFIAGEEVDEIQQLIGLIMVPGQFGLACPFELLMRAVGREAGGRLLDILRGIDIFQLQEDNVGNPIVEARTALEAQLIVRRTLAGAKGEIEYAIRLLSNVRSSFVTGSREVDFAVEFLRSIGPNGLREEYYRPHFVQIAACLRDLRTNRGVRHVRLLLQESAFLREAAKTSDVIQTVDDVTPDQHQLLEQALDACREALKQLNDHRSTRAMKSRLLVEMASTWGTLAKVQSDVTERLRMVTEAHEVSWQAFTIDAGNHYALDVIAWTGRDILKVGDLAPEDRMRIIESVAHAFAVADVEEWDAEAANHLDRRRVELHDLIFRSDVSSQAFDNLLKRGSAAGVVVRAWQLAEADDEPSNRKRRAAEALVWMDEPRHRQVVASDANAMFLRFKLWWRSKLGADFNAAERMALPFSLETWGECLSSVNALLSSERFHEHPTLRLIEAVALFHRGESSGGFAAFEAMNTELLFARNRVIRRFVFSDPQGKPRQFSGTVVRLEGRQGSLQVQGFGRWIPFFANEANRSDLRRGDDLHGFGIAFNMLGPIAEFRP